MNNVNQNGRSMVEMLGVLAIIGVLSVAGIQGYTTAMNKHRANEILNEASKRALIVASQIALGQEPNLNEFTNNNVGGAVFSTEITKEGADKFVIGYTTPPSAEVQAQIQAIVGNGSTVRRFADKGGLVFNNDLTTAPKASDYTSSDKCKTPFVWCESESKCKNAGDECLGCSTDAECDTICPNISYDCQEGGVIANCKVWCDNQTAAAGACRQSDSYSNSCINNKCRCQYACYPADMLVTLADGTTKRVDEITYDDELLVWNFDEGHFDSVYPLWLKVAEKAQEYNYLKFSDGSVLKTVNDHRILNRELGKFTSTMSDETPVGTHTLNAKGEWVTLVEKRVVQEEVVFYNIITDYHMNCFVGNILTSCRLNNLYPIQDLKFVKDNRQIVPYSEYAELPRKWYDGLRLGEFTGPICKPGEFDHGDKTVIDYVKRLMMTAQ